MTRRLRRAGVFAAIASLAPFAPVLGRAAAIPFAGIAGVLFFAVRDGDLFDTLALPGDGKDNRLYGVVAFALALAALALFTSAPSVPLPYGAFAAAALVVGFGRFGRELVRRRTDAEFSVVTGYLVCGGIAAVIGQFVAEITAGAVGDVSATGVTAAVIDVSVLVEATMRTDVAGLLPFYVFLASVSALTAALIRSLVYDRDTHITVIVVALVAWVFIVLVPEVTPGGVAAAVAVTVVLGYLSFALGTASVPGMLTGVLLALLTIVLGGIGWFLTLIAFYAIGGLASKYRFEEKTNRGVAQENQGARGTGNVLANSAVALAALVGFAASPHVTVSATIFAFAFAGAISTAMADTLSSEVGGLFDDPRLVTTFDTVDPGTDGAVTWQGEAAGVAGATMVALIAVVGMPLGDPLLGAGVIVVAGVVGMTVDSLLGALVEGDALGNQGVNFLATLAGALVAVGLWLVV